MAITLNGTTGVTTTGLTSNGIDDNATSTAMTLDSSGNLLVGTTSTSGFQTSSSATGTIAYTGGAIASNVSGDAPLYLNRLTSDGAIATFRKNGTTVGSIGVSGTFYLASNTASGAGGIRFGNDVSTTLILPSTNAGANKDGDVNLGYSSSRFKDLYLSGGVYLGGVGASNKLDDYEEGTWTPTFYSTGTATLTYARYVKIGNTVTFWVRVGFASGVTANSSRFTLPFSTTTLSSGTWTRGTLEGGFIEPQQGNNICYFSSSPSAYTGLFILSATYSTQP